MGKRTAGYLVIVVLCASAMLGAEFAIDAANTPPLPVSTIEEFRSWYPNCQLAEIEHAGKRYVVAFGGFWLFPFKERPPGYLFTAEGEFLTWSAEASDIDKNARFWGLAREALRKLQPSRNEEETQNKAIHRRSRSGVSKWAINRAIPVMARRSATGLMFNDPAYNAIAFIVAYGTLPIVIAGIALQLHRKNTRHVFAKPAFLVGAAIGVPTAVAILRANNISKYLETDFVFGVVLVIWLASLGGLAGAIRDRLRFGRSSPSQSDVM